MGLLTSMTVVNRFIWQWKRGISFIHANVEVPYTYSMLCVGVSLCECSLHTLLESFTQSDWRRDAAWIVDGEVTPLSLQRPPLQYIIILPCLSVNAS